MKKFWLLRITFLETNLDKFQKRNDMLHSDVPEHKHSDSYSQQIPTIWLSVSQPKKILSNIKMSVIKVKKTGVTVSFIKHAETK